MCTAPAFDCGTGTNLVCVVDQEGDTQGTCRLVCSSFSDCLDNPDARSHFDTDCCNVFNGTRVCAMASQLPQGSCN